jgi:23S rRNA (uracil1939-C5)-methyltransferase
MNSQSVSISNCPYCLDCGGCDYVDLPYSETLKIKLKEVKKLLKDNDAKPQNLENMAITASPKVFNYRNRCQLHIKNGVAGFFKKRTHDLIKIDKCLMLDERINQKIAELRFPRTYNGKVELYLRGNTVAERLVEKKYDNYFGQVNNHINAVITKKILELLAPQKSDELLELYCGNGNFTFAIAESTPGIKITGIDIKVPSTPRKGIEFLGVDAEKGLKQLASMGKLSSYNKVLLDPPRAGAGKNVSSIIASIRPERIVYVSCNPETNTEDANILCSKGYSWTHMELLDMFPFTKYVESISLFTRD